MNKRGQTEIIGFMIIILLLFFSLIFYFRFAGDSGSELIAEAEQNLEVSNLLSAMKLYTVCEGTSLGDAVKTCTGGGFACGEDACALVRRDVPALVALNGWEEDSYAFYIGEELYSPGTCTGNSFADDYTTGGVTVRLVHCY